ncbi:MAG: DNA-processing protein DprA, partial [Bacteroidaceae bacterium]|nr:DNA-processing protein DprA [Bacteroidaceae bacterium]
MNIIYDIAFAQLSHIKQQDKHLMLEKLGSAEEIYKQRNHLRDILPDTSKNIEKEVGVMEDWLRRAEEEALFIEKGGIKALRCYDKEYPQRLRQCSDAPTLLYYRGNIDLNAAHVVSVVGTRQITPYGKGLCESFVKDLSTLRPDVIVVSGLAYGVDIH